MYVTLKTLSTQLPGHFKLFFGSVLSVSDYTGRQEQAFHSIPSVK
jgi:hypothetical protein